MSLHLALEARRKVVGGSLVAANDGNPVATHGSKRVAERCSSVSHEQTQNETPLLVRGLVPVNYSGSCQCQDADEIRERNPASVSFALENQLTTEVQPSFAIGQTKHETHD